MPQYNKSEIGAIAKEYGFVRDTFEKVLRLKEILRFFNLEERKTQAKKYITNLMCLTESEREYMERFCAKEYRPELLFDDDNIIERIEAHPMALWKCKIER